MIEAVRVPPSACKHVAVERDGLFAQPVEVDDGAQRPADEPLDLLRAAALAPACGLARGASVRGAREHAVLGSDPAGAGATEEARHARLDAGGAEDAGVANGDQRGALGVTQHTGLDRDWTKCVGTPTKSALAHADLI